MIGVNARVSAEVVASSTKGLLQCVDVDATSAVSIDGGEPLAVLLLLVLLLLLLLLLRRLLRLRRGASLGRVAGGVLHHLCGQRAALLLLLGRRAITGRRLCAWGTVGILWLRSALLRRIALRREARRVLALGVRVGRAVGRGGAGLTRGSTIGRRRLTGELRCLWCAVRRGVLDRQLRRLRCAVRLTGLAGLTRLQGRSLLATLLGLHAVGRAVLRARRGASEGSVWLARLVLLRLRSALLGRRTVCAWAGLTSRGLVLGRLRVGRAGWLTTERTSLIGGTILRLRGVATGC